MAKPVHARLQAFASVDDLLFIFKCEKIYDSLPNKLRIIYTFKHNDIPIFTLHKYQSHTAFQKRNFLFSFN